MEIEEFKKKCNKKVCSRYTIYNAKTCVREYKQNQCYDKWIKKQVKDKEKLDFKLQEQFNKQKQSPIKRSSIKYKTPKVNEKEIELKKIIWKRDGGVEYDGQSVKSNWQDYCVFWNHIFTVKEKIMIFHNNNENLWLNRNLDLIHIISRSKSKKDIYEEKNILLGGRFFHSQLDGYKDLVTGEHMVKEQREKWLDRMKCYIESVYNKSEEK